jgi:hypothetical protein
VRACDVILHFSSFPDAQKTSFEAESALIPKLRQADFHPFGCFLSASAKSTLLAHDQRNIALVFLLGYARWARRTGQLGESRSGLAGCLLQPPHVLALAFGQSLGFGLAGLVCHCYQLLS